MSKLILPGHLKAQVVNCRVTCSGAGFSVEIGYEPAIQQKLAHTPAEKLAQVVAIKMATFLRDLAGGSEREPLREVRDEDDQAIGNSGSRLQPSEHV